MKNFFTSPYANDPRYYTDNSGAWLVGILGLLLALLFLPIFQPETILVSNDAPLGAYMHGYIGNTWPPLFTELWWICALMTFSFWWTIICAVYWYFMRGRYRLINDLTQQ